MYYYAVFLIVSIILMKLYLKKLNKYYLGEELKIILGLKNRESLLKLDVAIKSEYDETLLKIIKQENELENSIEELREYRNELEITYNSLVENSKKLEYSNKILEKKVEDLSNLNSVSRTVLSTFQLDSIIDSILDAYFALTGAKRISLYLWEGGRLINKRTKGAIDFKGELFYPKQKLKTFSSEDYKKIYEELSKDFILLQDEVVVSHSLVVKGKNLGVIYIIEDRDKMIKLDKEMVYALVIQVSIAINNSQIYSDLLIKERMSQELEMASRIQKQILPQELNKFKEIDIARYFQPAKEIGGDYYDYSVIDENTLSFTIADVSGKGMPAAFLMALIRSVLKTIMIVENIGPSEEINRLNSIIYPDISDEMFITMLHCRYSSLTNTLRYTNAGHNPILVYRAKTDTIEEHRLKGVAIGFVKDYKYKEAELKINSGDIVILYTDGITEAENKNREMFGIERLKESIYKHKDADVNSLKKSILNDINVFRNENEQVDDLTFILIKNNSN